MKRWPSDVRQRVSCSIIFPNSLFYNEISLRFFSEEDIRLYGQIGPYELAEGVLQIYRDNSWINVCGDSFSKRAAEVACQQMGYQ